MAKFICHIIIVISSFCILLCACKKEYSYEGGLNPTTPPAQPPPVDTTKPNEPTYEIYPDTAWRFESKGVVYYGFQSIAYFGRFITDATLDTTVSIIGRTPNQISQFSIAAAIDSFNIVVGKVYDARDIILILWDPPRGQTYFSESPYFFEHWNVNIHMQITFYDPATAVIKGIFYGNAMDGNSDIVDITNGRFQGKMHY